MVPKIIGFDPASKDGDWTAEVDGLHDASGRLIITDIRKFKDTIDLTATDVTDQKLIEQKRGSDADDKAKDKGKRK